MALVGTAVALVAAGPIGLPFRSSGVDWGAIAAAGAGHGDDPFAYSEDRRHQFESRAAAGVAHVLYSLSPGGVIASAKRTVRFRPQIDRAASRAGVDPDLMEAMVFLESAGRPQVMVGGDPANAAGLAQILPETASNLLGMHVDLAASRKLTAEIATSKRRQHRIPGRIAALRARQRKARKPRVRRSLQRHERRLRRLADALPARERQLRSQRARVDQRFDPDAALAGMARYLSIARARLGRSDLAVESYHMGIGNLESVIRAYAGSQGDTTISELVDRDGISYAKLYFDSSPLGHPAAWRILASLGDDSDTYLWRVLAARDILHLYRTNRQRLHRLIALETAKSTDENVLHPAGRTQVFSDPGDLADAYKNGTLVALPHDLALGLRVSRQVGDLAGRLGVKRSLYEGLRPAALATLVYMASRVHAISGHHGGPLIVSSAVRDENYQHELVATNPEATPNYSLHTTGWAFDVLRSYRSDREAAAFQFTLDRLRELGLIDYAKEPSAIHITVSDEGARLLDVG